ncbi:MAG: hypothetical protein AAGG51_04155 [Cyanobacteria bacterium P01_G01_bin.54]
MTTTRGISTDLSIHAQTELLEGNRVELTIPELPNLPVGTKLEVFVIIPQSPSPTKLSVFEMLQQAPPVNTFQTAEAVDQYLSDERGTWDK